MVSHRATQNWLVGLTRYMEIMERFPFLRVLSNRYTINTADCTNCGQKAQIKQFTNQVNDVLKILATIPESEITEFKKMVKVDRLHITYSDTRGQVQTAIR